MFDWLSDIFGSENLLSNVFSAFSGALTTGSQSSSHSLMRPKSVLDGTERRREYGSMSPTAMATRPASSASFEEINRSWERRMSRIMNKKIGDE